MPVDRQQIADEVALRLLDLFPALYEDGSRSERADAAALLPLFDRVAANAAADALDRVADQLTSTVRVRSRLREHARALRPSPVVTAREEQP